MFRVPKKILANVTRKTEKTNENTRNEIRTRANLFVTVGRFNHWLNARNNRTLRAIYLRTVANKNVLSGDIFVIIIFFNIFVRYIQCVSGPGTTQTNTRTYKNTTVSRTVRVAFR